MRDRAELDFIRDRVLAEIRATPPTGPLLTEVYAEPKPRRETCKRGHRAYVERYGIRECAECRRGYQQADRAKRSHP